MYDINAPSDHIQSTRGTPSEDTVLAYAANSHRGNKPL